MIERQEIHCHDCDQYVQFDIDVELNGEHVLNCPNCGHEHCRIVTDGIITDKRWDSRNGDMLTFAVCTGTMTSTATSIDTTSTGSSTFSTDMWLNATTSSSTGYY
jgi:hypothetical protein